ncbi:MAG: hypothetical protein FJ146_18140, partial [Deltaproteobacteria bacterium]|nr:hypothetical protein [Deltaproteobacteria bacterium]
MGQNTQKLPYVTARGLAVRCLFIISFAYLYCSPLPAYGQGVGSLPMTYSGRLTTQTGAPLSGSVNVTATFWDTELAGTQRGETFSFTSVNLAEGIFTIYFPFTVPQVQDIFGDGTTSIFIEIVADGKTYPRQKFNYVPLAMRIPVDAKSLKFSETNGILGIKGSDTANAGSVLVSDGSGGVKWDSVSAANFTAKTVSNTDPTANQVLTYQNGKWVAATPAATVTASGSGTITTGTGLTGGPITTSGTISLADTAVSPGTYTRANIVVDQQGRITSAITSAGIIDADISATAAIDQSKIAGLTAALTAKQDSIGSGTASQYLRGDKTWQSLNTANVQESGTAQYFSDARARASLTGITPVIYSPITGEIAIAQAGGTQNGYLSSTDWTTFNAKQNALGYTPVNRAGDTMNGALNMGGQGITALATPTAASDAATKDYVDTTTSALLKKDGSVALTGPWAVGDDLTDVGNLTLAHAKTLGLGVFDNAAEATMTAALNNSGANSPDKGKTWFNKDTNQIKYWDGSTSKTLGVSGAGLTSLNGLTGGTQTFASGNAGDSPAIVSSGSVHTLNIPLASAGASVTAGLVSNTDYAAFNSKVSSVTGTSPISVTGTTAPVISMAQASNSNSGFLSATDWATFNAKQDAGNYISQLAGDAAIAGFANGTGTVSLASVAMAGTATKVTYDVKGRVTSGTSLSAADIPTLTANQITNSLGYTPVNRAGDSLSGGLNLGSFDISNTGNIQMTASKTLALSSNSADPAGLVAADKGKTWFNTTSNQIKYWDGSAVVAVGASLSTLNGQTGSTQTFAVPGTSGSAPAWSSAANAHTLNIPMASTASVTAGLISNTDYTAFSSKVTNVTQGTGIAVSTASGTATVSLASTGTAGTFVKVTTDAYGRVTAGTSLISADLPPHSAALITSGSLSLANGGTGADLSSTGGTGQYLKQSTTGGPVTVGALASGDVIGALGFTPVNKAGDSLSGALNLGSNKIINLATPTAATDAANKSYVDANLGGSQFDQTSKINDYVIKWNNSLSKYYLAADQTGSAGGGITSFNGLNAASQTLAVGSAGTTPAFSSATSTHTLNIPMASTASVTAGLISNTEYSTFNSKQAPGNYITQVTGDVTLSGFASGTATATLASVATAGTATKVTYDAKGRVLSGTSLAAADLPSHSAGLITSGTLNVANGGTGATTLAANNVLLGNGTNALQTIAPGTSGNVLTSNGTTWQSTALPASISSVSGTSPISVTGTTTPVVSIAQASGSANGFLSSTDWTTFNAKQAPGNYVTQLAGDATIAGFANGTGTVSLASISIAGTSTKVTYDVKGRVTSGTSLSAADIPTLTSTQITTSLGYTPINRAGDSMSGALNHGAFDITNTGTIQMAASKTLALSTNTSDPAGLVAADKGKTWFNSSTNQIKYWDGSAAMALGVAGSGLSSLNGQTGNTQTFTVPGTSGTAPAWSSAANTHTLNIPMASVASVTAGLLSNADYTAFSNKVTNVAQGTGIAVATASGTATVNLATTGTAGNYTKVTTDAYGRVTAGTSLLPADLPPHSAALITSGTLNVANGGTGTTTLAANNVLLGNGTNALQTIAPGTSGNVLTSNGTTWQSTALPASVTSVSGTSPISVTGTTTPVVSIAQASSSANGFLSSTDWTTFNNMLAKSGDTMTGVLALPANGLVVGTSQLVSFNGNIGIGTTAPEVELDVVGSSLNNLGGAVLHYRSLATYTGGSAVTGTMKITLPKLRSNTMLQIRISGYNYNAAGAWELLIGGYNRATGIWGNTSATLHGRAPFNSVRLAEDGTASVILLGTTTTSWAYPKIVVNEAITSYSTNYTGWGSGWSIAPITDESGIVNVATPDIDFYVASNGNVGIGTTNPTQTLVVNGAGNITSLGVGSVADSTVGTLRVTANS